ADRAVSRHTVELDLVLTALELLVGQAAAGRGNVADVGAVQQHVESIGVGRSAGRGYGYPQGAVIGTGPVVIVVVTGCDGKNAECEERDGPAHAWNTNHRWISRQRV